MPVLLMLYPDSSPELLACISLAVVFFNAASGTFGYARMRMIDYRSGLIFAAATVPGAVLGALTTGKIPRQSFDILLGTVLAIFAIFLLIYGRRIGDSGAAVAHGDSHKSASTSTLTPRRRMLIGAAISLVVGYLSSLLGIGGGIIHVPLLVVLLGFPVHIATATSHFVLAISSFSGTAAHIATGAFDNGGARRTLALGIGVIIGAQFGARWSRRTPPAAILRGLGVALLAAAARIIWQVL